MKPHFRPRILLLSTAYLPLVGGSELAIHHITRRLPRYDFDLVTGRYGNEPTMEVVGNVRVFRIGSFWTRGTFMLPKLLLPLVLAFRAWRLTNAHAYELMHAYQASQAAGAAFLLKMLHPHFPFLLTLQEGKNLEKQGPAKQFLRKFLLRRADRITAISAYLADYAHRVAPNTPVDTIPNGVELGSQSRPILNPDPTILTVSRLVPKNNVEAIIRALPEVRQHIANARLLIVGDGPLREDLERLASELEVRDAVHFTGTVSHENVQPLYSMADVFVRPSLSEGLGNAFLEAMAARVPIVGSSVGGIKDFLVDGVTGTVCDPKDPKNIAQGIVRILTDPGLRRTTTEHAFMLVQERYTWDAIAEQMASVYEQLT